MNLLEKVYIILKYLGIDISNHHIMMKHNINIYEYIYTFIYENVYKLKHAILVFTV